MTFRRGSGTGGSADRRPAPGTPPVGGRGVLTYGDLARIAATLGDLRALGTYRGSRRPPHPTRSAPKCPASHRNATCRTPSSLTGRPTSPGHAGALAEAVDTGLGTAKTVAIATAEARTNTAYGLHTTPDRISSVVVPANALVLVAYRAYWKSSVSAAGSAAIFVGSNQIQYMDDLGDEDLAAQTVGTAYNQLGTTGSGLASSDNTGDRPQPGAGKPVILGPSQVASTVVHGGPVWLWNIAAGTYDFTVQTKSSSGSVTLKERQLWVWVLGFQ